MLLRASQFVARGGIDIHVPAVSYPLLALPTKGTGVQLRAAGSRQHRQRRK